MMLNSAMPVFNTEALICIYVMPAVLGIICTAEACFIIVFIIEKIPAIHELFVISAGIELKGACSTFSVRMQVRL